VSIINTSLALLNTINHSVGWFLGDPVEELGIKLDQYTSQKRFDFVLDWPDYGKRMVWWGEDPPTSLRDGLDTLHVDLWPCSEVPTSRMLDAAQDMCKRVVEGRFKLQSVCLCHFNNFCISSSSSYWDQAKMRTTWSVGFQLPYFIEAGVIIFVLG
jgi:hypothetical protein